MALRHMSRKSGMLPQEVTSAREIADSYGLPFEITAKTLQRLKDTGLIQSAQGAKGGYTLHKTLDQVSLADFLNLMEGQQPVVPCASSVSVEHHACEYKGQCEIKLVMGKLNHKINGFLSGISLAELADQDHPNNLSLHEGLEP